MLKKILILFIFLIFLAPFSWADDSSIVPILYLFKLYRLCYVMIGKHSSVTPSKVTTTYYISDNLIYKMTGKHSSVIPSKVTTTYYISD